MERKEAHTEKGRSEFHYGAMYRAVMLPPDIRLDTLAATYTDGILEVTALVAEHDPETKTVAVTVNKPTAE